MGNKIRIQPEMVEVPPENPFEHDLLNRETAIEALTNVIDNIEGPCVMAVDAPWGMGKTTFIRMWEQHLRSRKFPVVSFNAWETDYSADPFSALSIELLQELEDFERGLQKKKAGQGLSKHLKTLREVVRTIPRKTLPVLIRGLSDATGIGLVGMTIAQIVEDNVPKDTDGQQNIREALVKFRGTLGKMASALIEETEQRSLVIIIDELDRCRPSYAIELLEIAKHFFNVDHVVFVLAINFTELSHSIRAVYGEGFNARSYLERFFDIDFKLPDTDKKQFIHANLQTMKIDQYLSRTEDPSAKNIFPTIADVFSAFFVKANISLRRISQVMHRLGLILATLPNNQLFLGWASTAALVMRAIDSDLYEKFVGRSVDDKKVIDSIFSHPEHPELADIRSQHEGHLFEGIVIVGYAELKSGGALELSAHLSPYYRTLEQRAKTVLDGTEPTDERTEHAKAIVHIVELLTKESQRTLRRIFPLAIERIELFSAALAQEDNPHK